MKKIDTWLDVQRFVHEAIEVAEEKGQEDVSEEERVEEEA
jgi:hypothetical protein